MHNINSNHSNLAFEEEVKKCHKWMKSKIHGFSGYSSEILVDRLLQRYVELCLTPYITVIKNKLNVDGGGGGDNYLPEPGSRINCDRLYMEVGSGRISLSLKQWVKNQINFIKHWVFCFTGILVFKRSIKNRHTAVLVYGVAEGNLFVEGSDERFITYCRNGPITPLNTGKRFIIYYPLLHTSEKPEEFIYSNWPLIRLLQDTNLGFVGRFNLFVWQILLFFSYLAGSIRYPQLSLVGDEIAYRHISFELDKRQLIESIVFTCSNYTSQPLWTRGLKNTTLHMIWYAQNWNQITYSADNLKSDRPSLRWIRVDKHWVWTHAFANYLEYLGLGKDIEVVGPIVWYLPENESPAEGLLKIVIFDDPPFGEETALKIGQLNNYLNPNNLYVFIENIVSLKPELEKTFQLPVIFSLKTKRGYKGNLDKAYFEFLDKLELNNSILLEKPSVNLYSLISGCQLVIAYPFTSPAYIAETLKVPCIYYDPTGSICFNNFADAKSYVHFANSPKSLLNLTTGLINKAVSSQTVN